MYQSILRKTICLLLLLITITSFSQQKISPLMEYVGISKRQLKKKYRKAKIKLLHNKNGEYYYDQKNSIQYYYNPKTKKVHSILSQYGGRKLNTDLKIPYDVYNNKSLLEKYVVKVDNPKRWVMKIDQSIRLYRNRFGYVLTDISSTTEEYIYHISKVLSNETLKNKRTKFGDFKEYQYPKWVPLINAKTIHKCITNNCDKSGENVVIAYLNRDQEGNGIEYRGVFKDGVATGKGTLTWAKKDKVSVKFSSTFYKGEASGNFNMEIRDKNNILNWQYEGSIHRGVFTKLKFKNYDFKVYGTWEQLDDKSVLVDYDNKGYLYPGKFEIWGVKKTFKDGLNGTFLYDGTGYLFPFCLHSFPIYSYFGSFSKDFYLKKNTRSRIKGDKYAGFEWGYYWDNRMKKPASDLDLPFYRNDLKK